MAASAANELTAMRRIVARHIHCAITADKALTSTTGGLTADAADLVKGAANSARGLLDALTVAGIDLTAELDRAAR